MMFVRVMRVDVEPDRIAAVVSRYREVVRPIHEQAAGLRRHYVLVDREEGRITMLGLWHSHESLKQVASTLEPARERLWSEFGQTPTLETYEVADELEHPPLP
jgi:quinol monooxygenase YgiN